MNATTFTTIATVDAHGAGARSRLDHIDREPAGLAAVPSPPDASPGPERPGLVGPGA
jgi:hypothetical protein